MCRRGLVPLLGFVALLALTQSAQSQAWPRKPVKIVVPFAAGGNTDIIARIVAQPLSEAFGQPFVVENRPGATGVIAAEAVARSSPDGHTLFMATLPQIAIVPAMIKAPYDAVKDFVPISNIGTNPSVLVVRPSLPASTLAEFTDYVRRHPGKLTYVAPGVGSLNHLSMVLFLKRTDLTMTPVMYKGGPAGLNDVVAGHVDAYFANLSVVVPHAATGALRLLAVTGENRARQIPHVATLAESGVPGLTSLLWTGLMAPAGTPGEIIDRIARAVSQAISDPRVAERLAGNGVDPLGNSPAEFAATIAQDIALWAEAIKIAGVSQE